MAEQQNEAEAIKPTDSAPSTKTISPSWIAFWTAFVYLIGVLVVAGGAGIWLPSVLSKPLSIDALTTYVFALLAPVVTDLILDLDLFRKSFSKLGRVFFFSSWMIAGALAVIALLRVGKPDEWVIGWISVFLSLIIWMVIAMKTDRFLPEPQSKTGSIGGETPGVGGLGGPGLTGS